MWLRDATDIHRRLTGTCKRDPRNNVNNNVLVEASITHIPQ